MTDKPVGDEQKWVYCNQHLYPHCGDWCTVSARNKTPLKATTFQEAITECRERGLTLYESK